MGLVQENGKRAWQACYLNAEDINPRENRKQKT
jgi:hypothetical protein